MPVGGALAAWHRRSAMPDTTFYADALARLHVSYYEHVARAAARVLLARLGEAGFSSGRIVDLGVGGGPLARAALDAGFEVTGVDVSAAMLELAAARLPEAELVLGSAWQVDLPRCVAITAVGETFCYAQDDLHTLAGLGRRLGDLAEALEPQGILLFDLAGPGRAGPEGERWAEQRFEGARIRVHHVESADHAKLVRDIEVFVEGQTEPRREQHTLTLYPPEAVLEALTTAGFEAEALPFYPGAGEHPGWTAYLARRA